MKFDSVLVSVCISSIYYYFKNLIILVLEHGGDLLKTILTYGVCNCSETYMYFDLPFCHPKGLFIYPPLALVICKFVDVFNCGADESSLGIFIRFEVSVR